NHLALLEVVRVDLGPGDAFVRAMLGCQGHLVQFERLEHLGSRRRAARQALYQEAAPPAAAPLELEAKAAELGGDRVVDEEKVHSFLPPAETSAENCSASRGKHTSWAYCSCIKSAAASPRGR